MNGADAIEGLVLNVQSPERLAAFYTERLGMRLEEAGEELRLGYEGPGAYVALRRSPSPAPYRYDEGHRYWKIGITLPDVDFAYRQLASVEVPVSAPRQFRDIGYLCHLTDPEGFRIELLQHSFEGEERSAEGDRSKPLGGGATLGQITLRTADIEADLSRFETGMGMTLLSKQPVEDFGFDLYFLARTEERPPNPDLTSLENRPWLWRRPYTTLEFQHLRASGATIRFPEPRETGYGGLRIANDKGGIDGRIV